MQRLYEERNLPNPNQYDFRAKLGTEIALMKIHESIAINQKYRDNYNIVTRGVWPSRPIAVSDHLYDQLGPFI